MAPMETEEPAAPAPHDVAHGKELRRLRQRALLELARRQKAELPDTLRAVTERAAAALGVARASIWRLERGRKLLSCLDVYGAAEAQHHRGARLAAEASPRYFEALLQARTIATPDARRDARTAELREGYLEPLGITSMLDVPIWSRGSLYGVLCLEHVGPPRTWSAEEVDFAANLADIVALALTAAEHARIEQRWQAVFEAMSECVVVVDANNDILLMNHAARALFPSADLGRTFSQRRGLLEFHTLSGQPLPPERWPGPRALRGERVQGELAEVHVLATGRRRVLRMTTAQLREGETVIGGLMVFSDVTEQLQFERLKRDFLAELAHELRTPVAITQLSAQHVAAAASLPAALRPRLEAITRASTRMARLVDDIVEVSSVMLGDLVLARRPVELGALVRELVEAAAPGARGERLRVVEAAEPLHVLADPERLSNALRHLVDNALRYAPGGEVRVEVRRAGDCAEVCVRDQGIGIPADKLPHVFELFYRAHAGTPHDVGGMGVGLFLCRELLRLHGGSVHVQSTEGVGSTFRARLPLAEVH